MVNLAKEHEPWIPRTGRRVMLSFAATIDFAD